MLLIEMFVVFSRFPIVFEQFFGKLTYVIILLAEPEGTEGSSPRYISVIINLNV